MTRAPSTGRDIGLSLRKAAGTRHVPIVFAGGDPDKVASARAVLPDAVFCQWDGIAAALDDARANMPDEPLVPAQMAGYSGTPLAKKLGIKPGSRLCLIGAPQGFLAKLKVPPGTEVRERAAESERVLWFVRSRRDLESGLARAGNAVAEKGGLWVIWPKKTSGIETDISQPEVRAFCLERGWVDYKVCAVDETWSGLLFARKAFDDTPKHGQRI
jgi:hypothetical protein